MKKKTSFSIFIAIIFTILIFNIANAGEEKTGEELWTKQLPSLSEPLISYRFFNNSEEALSQTLLELVGTEGSKRVMDFDINVIKSDNNEITVESVFVSPHMRGNRVSTTFNRANFSMKTAHINESYQGENIKNRLSIMESKSNSGENVRTLIETSGTVSTRFLDNIAPIIDVNSLVYLIQGNSGNPNFLDKKPLFFYFNGLVRKVILSFSGEDKIMWLKDETRQSLRFDLTREGQNIGSIWIDKSEKGYPLKLTVGKLIYLVDAKD